VGEDGEHTFTHVSSECQVLRLQVLAAANEIMGACFSLQRKKMAAQGYDRLAVGVGFDNQLDRARGIKPLFLNERALVREVWVQLLVQWEDIVVFGNVQNMKAIALLFEVDLLREAQPSDERSGCKNSAWLKSRRLSTRS
jgi:hypothetical protein